MPSERKSGSSSSLASASGARRSPSDAMNASISIPKKRQRLPQERKLHRALALLDQVQVGGRDAERARHVRLLQPALEPQLAQPPTDVGVVAQCSAIATILRNQIYKRLTTVNRADRSNRSRVIRREHHGVLTD